MNESILIDFTLLFNRFKKPLFNYACKITRSEVLSEDICQNVFIKLFNNLNKIRNADLIEIWIFRTCRNEIFDHFRRNKKRIAESMELNEGKISTSSLFDDFEKKELIELIEDELKEIDTSHSEVYYLKEFSGLSYREIALIMEITEDVVRSRLFRVRQKLKKAIIKYERG